MATEKNTLTAQTLKTLLHYDSATGLFKRFKSFGGKGNLDSPGGLDKNGYLVIGVSGHDYLAHRLAWLYSMGRWPDEEIDHRDGNRANNRLENLREATHRLQLQNLKRARTDNAIQVLGVSRRSAGYRARITLDGKTISLGTFPTSEEAHTAYLAAKRKFHPFGTL